MLNCKHNLNLLQCTRSQNGSKRRSWKSLCACMGVWPGARWESWWKVTMLHNAHCFHGISLIISQMTLSAPIYFSARMRAKGIYYSLHNNMPSFTKLHKEVKFGQSQKLHEDLGKRKNKTTVWTLIWNHGNKSFLQTLISCALLNAVQSCVLRGQIISTPEL